MKKVTLAIDHQKDPKRQSKFRLRVIAGTGKNRVELKALYFKKRLEAQKMKKHLRDVVSALQEVAYV